MISKNNYLKILEILERKYPQVKTELHYHNGFELLIAVILSAQTTDKQVNKVTPKLFKKFPTPKKLGSAPIVEVENLINSIGLYHNKSKNIIKAAQIIHQDFADQLPDKKLDLMKLPGVGEKTASVVMGDFYEVPSLAVDTHVQRLAKRWNVVSQKATVDEVQAKLMKLTPKAKWIATHHRLVLFGRYFCTARAPKCEQCELLEFCCFGQKRLGIKK